MLPLLWGRIRPTPMRAGTLPKRMQPQASWAVPSSRSHGSSAGPCAQASPSQQCSDSPHHRSYSRQCQFAKGRAVAPPLSQAANNSRIDASVPHAHNLGSRSSGRCRCRCRRGGRRVKPSKCLPTEVERIETARRRVVSSKCGHASFCIHRESANDFVHIGLSGSREHAWACCSWGGQLDERERGEASDPTV